VSRRVVDELFIRRRRRAFNVIKKIRYRARWIFRTAFPSASMHACSRILITFAAVKYAQSLALWRRGGDTKSARFTKTEITIRSALFRSTGHRNFVSKRIANRHVTSILYIYIYTSMYYTG